MSPRAEVLEGSPQSSAMRKPVLGLVRNSPAYMCFLVMGCGPHSWFGRITHDAPGGFSNIFTDSTHLLLPGDAAGPNTKMNEVIKSSTVYLDGRFLVHSTPPRGLPEPARRVGREAAATLCCGGCGTVPGFTSRPRGGAWLASLSQVGYKSGPHKRLCPGQLFSALSGLMSRRQKLPRFCQI